VPILYIAEYGYGNLGDDAPVELLRRHFKAPIEPRPFSGLSGQECYEKVIIGAGTVLDLGNSFWMQKMTAIAALSKRTILLCPGLDAGQPWSQEGIDGAAALFQHIKRDDRLLRGPISVELLKLAGCGDSDVGLDPMVLLAPPARPGGGNLLVVPGYQGRTTAGPHFQEQMVVLSRRAVKEGHRVEFHPVWLRDLDLAAAYSREVEGSVLDYGGCGVDALASKMANSKAVISNRMHGALLALVCGTPALFISHHSKVQDMCLALGWRWYVDAGNPRLEDYAMEFLEALPEPPKTKLAHYRRVMLTYLQRIARD
jgi:hypothetical protein